MSVFRRSTPNVFRRGQKISIEEPLQVTVPEKLKSVMGELVAAYPELKARRATWWALRHVIIMPPKELLATPLLQMAKNPQDDDTRETFPYVVHGRLYGVVQVITQPGKPVELHIFRIAKRPTR